MDMLTGGRIAARGRTVKRIFACALCFMMLALSVPSQAAGDSFYQFVTNVTLTIYENDGVTQIITLDKDNPNAGDANIPADASVSLKFTFTLPDDDAGTVYSGGDAFPLTLPSVFDTSSLAGLPIDLLVGSGPDVFGTFDLVDGVPTVTLDDYVNGKYDRGGEFTFSADFADDTGGDGQPVEVSFTISAATVVFTLGFEAPEPAGITKTGAYANDTITWTVTADAGAAARTGIYAVDTLGSGQTFVSGSVKSGGGVLIPEGDPGTDTAPFYTFNAGTDVLTVYLPDLSAAQTYAFTYDATPTVYNGSVNNDVDLYVEGPEGNPIFSGDASAQVTVSTVWIEKEGAVTRRDSANRPLEIEWRIGVNPQSRTITSAVLTDIIPRWLVLDEDSVVLEDSEGTSISLVKDVAAPNGYTLASYAGSRHLLTYSFGTGSVINESYTLTYTTTVDLTYYNTNQTGSFINSATLTATEISGNSTDSGTVPGGSSILDKTSVAGSYDHINRKVTWQIVVNGDSRSIQNAVVTDTIPAGQLFVPGSFRIRVQSSPDYTSVTENDGGALNYVAGNPSGGTLMYDFGNSQPEDNEYITAPYVIRFETEVVDPNVYASNLTSTVNNNATLVSDNGISAADGASYQVQSTVIDKTCTAYDHVTRALTWQVALNHNGIAMGNAVVADTMQAGQTFLGGMQASYDGGTSFSDLAEWVAGNPEPSSYPYYTYDAGILKAYLGPVAQGQKPIIRFETTLSESVFAATNTSFTVYNTASLNSGIAGAPDVSDTGSRLINHWVIQKTNAVVPEGQLYIDWTVDINLNQIGLTHTAISDTLQTGLELDTSSVKLQHMTLNRDGTQTPGAFVSLTQNSFSYGPNNLFVFNLPASPEKAAYRLTFTTLVTNVAAGPFNNTATLSGTSVDYSDAPQAVISIRALSDGIGYGTLRGTLEIYKTDTGGNPIAQAGTAFALYDQYGNFLRTAATDAFGVASFVGLNFDTQYSIEETKAPVGYAISTGRFTFTIDPEGNVGVVGTAPTAVTITGSSTVAFADDLLRASIRLTKTDMEGIGLAGGRFSIYTESDTDFTSALQTVTSNENGLILFSGLTAGSYVIREVSPPSGYYGSEEVRTATLTLNVLTNTIADVTVEETFANERIPSSENTGSIRLQKEDSFGEPLSGAEFGLYTQSGRLVQTAVSNSSGMVRFLHVPYGTYTIRELSAPDGYVPTDTVATATVSSQNALVQASPYTIVNLSDIEIIFSEEIPKAGGFFDTTLLAFLGVLLLLTGFVMLFIRSVSTNKRK